MWNTLNKKGTVVAIIALLALSTAIYLVTQTRPDTSPKVSRQDGHEATSERASDDELRKDAARAETSPGEPVASARHPAGTSTEELSRQTVFRIILEDGACRLDAIEEVVGDFRARRGTTEVHPGMIACRLIGPDGQIISERQVHPPDHVCVVLDPHAGENAPEPVMLAGLGPQVFQVHFPAELIGERLEVYRITRTRGEPVETLLLTVPIEP